MVGHDPFSGRFYSQLCRVKRGKNGRQNSKLPILAVGFFNTDLLFVYKRRERRRGRCTLCLLVGTGRIFQRTMLRLLLQACSSMLLPLLRVRRARACVAMPTVPNRAVSPHGRRAVRAKRVHTAAKSVRSKAGGTGTGPVAVCWWQQAGRRLPGRRW